MPAQWKRWVLLGLLGWLVESLFGVEGVLVLLLCLFTLGFAIAALNPVRGKRMSAFAADEFSGQASDLVTLPLLAPIAFAWWQAAKTVQAGEFRTAIGYSAVFVAAHFLVPPMVRLTLHPEEGRPKRRAGGRRRTRTVTARRSAGKSPK